MSIFEDGLSVLLAVLVIIAVALFGYSIGTASVRFDCDNLNAFYKGDKVYVCQRVK